MKKFLTIALCGLLAASAVLSGCTNEKTDDKKKNDEVVNQQQDEQGDKEDKQLTFAQIDEKIDALAAKNEQDKNILVTINDVEMSEAAVRYAVISANSALSDETKISKEIEDFYLLNAAILEEADKLGVNMTEKDFQSNVEAMKLYYEQYYGEEYPAIFEETVYSPYFFYLNQCYNVIFSNVFGEYTKDDSSELSKTIRETAFNNSVEQLKAGEYIRAKHILVQFPTDEEGNVVEDKKAEALSKANEILDMVNAITEPSEFDALMAEFGEDPGMESYPEGYYFTKGEMVAPFEEAAYALSDFETSGLVETSYGYHILQKLPYDVNTVMKSSLVSNDIFNNEYNLIAVEKMRDILLEKAADYKIEYSEGYDAAVEKYVDEYNTVWKVKEQEAAQQEADHDHE